MPAAVQGVHRTVLATLAVLSILAMPAAAAEQGAGPCGPANPFNKAVVCVQDYALCISAPCVETGKTGPGGKPLADCKCEVIHGASIGKASCSARAPAVSTSGATKLISTYSFQQTLPEYKLMTCPAEINGQPSRYADCYNMPCVVDPKDPAHATCKCPIFESKGGTFITRGGNCDTSACSKIWSGAPTAADDAVNWQFACNLGMPQPPQASCQ